MYSQTCSRCLAVYVVPTAIWEKLTGVKSPPAGARPFSERAEHARNCGEQVEGAKEVSKSVRTLALFDHERGPSHPD